MSKLTLFLAGISAALMGWVIVNNQRKAMRPVPVKDAADMLQHAWADHHTRP